MESEEEEHLLPLPIPQLGKKQNTQASVNLSTALGTKLLTVKYPQKKAIQVYDKSNKDLFQSIKPK